MTTLSRPLLLLGLALLLSQAGCAVSGSPDVDARFGEAARALRAQQMIDPAGAATNAGKAINADGRNVRDAVDRNGESYRTPPPSTIIVGGGTTTR